jgi:sulfate/thiosulfate transport system permease protein
VKTNVHSLGAWLLVVVVVLYIGFLILAPISALINGAFKDGLQSIWNSLTNQSLLQSLWLSLKIALLVVLVQAIFGTIVAWVFARQDFIGKELLNGVLDIPFALSPVVVGYMLLLLFGRNGILSPVLDLLNIKVAFAVPGMFLATLFVSLPFMIREMVPVIKQLDLPQENAAATLGANYWTIFWRVIFPQLKTAIVYGMTLTFARALGEFGAVLVIGGGVQGRTETATLYIFRSLDERQTTDAYVASIILGCFSVLIVSLADSLKRKQSQ